MYSSFSRVLPLPSLPLSPGNICIPPKCVHKKIAGDSFLVPLSVQFTSRETYAVRASCTPRGSRSPLSSPRGNARLKYHRWLLLKGTSPSTLASVTSLPVDNGGGDAERNDARLGDGPATILSNRGRQGRRRGEVRDVDRSDGSMLKALTLSDYFSLLSRCSEAAWHPPLLASDGGGPRGRKSASEILQLPRPGNCGAIMSSYR